MQYTSLNEDIQSINSKPRFIFVSVMPRIQYWVTVSHFCKNTQWSAIGPRAVLWYSLGKRFKSSPTEVVLRCVNRFISLLFSLNKQSISK